MPCRFRQILFFTLSACIPLWGQGSRARRFKSSGRRLTSANILDSESKISPLSSPRGNLAGLVQAAELLGFGFVLMVGWTDPEGSRPYLGACSPTMIPTDALYMPAAPAPASNRPSWRDCGAGCSPSRPTRCRSRCRRRVTAASDRRSSSAVFTGYGPSWSPKSNI